MPTTNNVSKFDVIDKLLLIRYRNQDADTIKHLEKHVNIKTLKAAEDEGVLKKCIDPYGRDVYKLTPEGVMRRNKLLQ